ncbi:MAG: RHS repeat-associated core domain-containing protein [Phycisphaeraceae bacterium]
MTRTTYHDNTSSTTGYDYAGRRVSETDPLGRTTNYTYDTTGRLIAVTLPMIDPDGSATGTTNTDRPTYAYGYDQYGNQTTITDPIGVSTTGDPTDRVTQFTFDDRGRQTTRTLPDTSIEQMVYDDTPIATVQAGPNPGLSVAGGQLEYTIDFEGRVTAYRYDNTAIGRGRQAAVYYYNDLASYQADTSLANSDRKVEYTYDAFGRVVQMIDSGHGSGGGTTTHTYDIEGRLTQIDSPEGVLNYAYDEFGRKERAWSSTDTTGSTAITDTEYTYDELGRLETVDVLTRNSAPVTEDPTTYHYDEVGNLDAMEQYNGVTVDYVYDSLHRLDALYHFIDLNSDDIVYDAGIDTLLASFDYTLDAAGNRTAASEFVDADGDGVVDTDETYDWLWAYDGLNRLRSETLDAGDDALDYTDTFDFDDASNRTQATRDEGSDGSVEATTTYTYDDNDRLLTETKDTTGTADDRHTVYAYGPSNNLTTQTGKTVHAGLDNTGTVRESTSMSYDVMGRLSSTTVTTYDSAGVQTQEVVTDYGYNAGGLRVQETTTVDPGSGGTPVVKTFHFDPSNPTGYAQALEEYVDGVLSRTYTLGHDVISQHDTSGGNGVLTMLYDGHGSTRALLTTAAALLEVYLYDAYGNLLEGTGLTTASAALTRILYSGEWTQTNGTQYLRARFYDPSSGRFNRLDPYAGNMSDPLSLHKYLYTHGNPVMGIDPSGNRISILGSLSTVGLIKLFSVSLLTVGSGALAISSAVAYFKGGYGYRHKVEDFIKVYKNNFVNAAQQNNLEPEYLAAMLTQELEDIGRDDYVGDYLGQATGLNESSIGVAQLNPSHVIRVYGSMPRGEALRTLLSPEQSIDVLAGWLRIKANTYKDRLRNSVGDKFMRYDPGATYRSMLGVPVNLDDFTQHSSTWSPPMMAMFGYTIDHGSHFFKPTSSTSVNDFSFDPDFVDGGSSSDWGNQVFSRYSRIKGMNIF